MVPMKTIPTAILVFGAKTVLGRPSFGLGTFGRSANVLQFRGECCKTRVLDR